MNNHPKGLAGEALEVLVHGLRLEGSFSSNVKLLKTFVIGETIPASLGSSFHRRMPSLAARKSLTQALAFRSTSIAEH